jgi:tryptophanyl-tRNA synthetase
VRQNPELFKSQCYDILAIYLASGLDPKQSYIFLQSQVSSHAQLGWILGCYTYMGELNRMTQFKDKSKRHSANINVGLFTYPTLMAADILLYQTDLVPVGADQKQHLELARDLAIRFNGIYGNTFTIPEVYHPPLGARIMSLQEPDKKMSKSCEDPMATIFLSDTPDEIMVKFRRAVTDSEKAIYFNQKNKPGIANLLTLLAITTSRSIEELVREVENYGYGKFKELVADSVIECLKPVQEQYGRLRKDYSYLNSILSAGAEYAKQTSQETLKLVYEKLGFIL